MMNVSIEQEHLQQVAHTLLRAKARVEADLGRLQSELKDINDALARCGSANRIEDEGDQPPPKANGRDEDYEEKSGQKS